jgi:hypothetical protein
MSGRILSVASAVAVLALVLGAPALRAQGLPPGTVTVTSYVNGIAQFTGDLDGGGDVAWNSATVGATVSRQFVPAFWGGVSLRYDAQDWTFHDAAGTAVAAPWRHLRHPSVGLNLNLALSKTLVLGVSPSAEWLYDTAAGTDDALIYGSVVSLAKVFRPGFVLGGGASIYRQFYNVKVSPFVIVNWKLNERWKIANAFAAGPVGGAGVELRYAPGKAWETAVGGVWRSERFRLAGDGTRLGDVGETSMIPLFARVSRSFATHYRLDAYAGAMTAGEVRLKDPDGNARGTLAYDAAPAVSLTLSGKW